MSTRFTEKAEKALNSSAEIAEKLGISRSYVSRIEKRALSKLYLYLSKSLVKLLTKSRLKHY